MIDPLDAIDRRILGVLQKDSRVTNAELSERVNLSPSACHRRVQRLEQDGYIAAYVALLDARKGLKMFEKVGIPILGIVENMSIHICSNCGHAEHIFGEGGGQKMCADFGVDFLGGLPLTMAIRQQADSGTPTVVAEPDGQIAGLYKDIARKVAIKVAEKAKDMTSKFPTITIQHT